MVHGERRRGVVLPAEPVCAATARPGRAPARRGGVSVTLSDDSGGSAFRSLMEGDTIVSAPRSIERRVFSKFPVDRELPMPNLLDVQLASFRSCMGTGSTDEAAETGLDEIFRKFFPVEGHQGNYSLEYKGYRLGQPKHTIQECRERNLTFEAPLKATLRLVRWEPREGGQRKFIEAEEAEIYLGDIPLITERGTFIVNGAERVIVSQLHRSPGVFFQEKIHPNGTMLYFAKIIPYRGTWVEVRMGIKDEMFIRTDRRHQFRMTTFLRAFGYSKDEEIRGLFYSAEVVDLPPGRPSLRTPPCGRVFAETIVDKETGEVVAERGEVVAPPQGRGRIRGGVAGHGCDRPRGQHRADRCRAGSH